MSWCSFHCCLRTSSETSIWYSRRWWHSSPSVFVRPLRISSTISSISTQIEPILANLRGRLRQDVFRLQVGSLFPRSCSWLPSCYRRDYHALSPPLLFYM